MRTRAARYWDVARLILLDSLWRFRRELGVLLVASGGALAVQAGALALFIYYARTLESRAELTVFADPPRKDLEHASSSIYYRFRDGGHRPEYEFFASSPYFIPTDEMIRDIKRMVDQGITYRVLTNSLDSNDVTLAQYGYAARRRALLENEVELHEFRSDAQDRARYTAAPYRDTELGLHAKVSVIDDRYVLLLCQHFNGLVVCRDQTAQQ